MLRNLYYTTEDPNDALQTTSSRQTPLLVHMVHTLLNQASANPVFLRIASSYAVWASWYRSNAASVIPKLLYILVGVPNTLTWTQLAEMLTTTLLEHIRSLFNTLRTAHKQATWIDVTRTVNFHLKLLSPDFYQVSKCNSPFCCTIIGLNVKSDAIFLLSFTMLSLKTQDRS